MPSPGEAIRDHYRRQGAIRTVDRIIRDFQDDAFMSMFLTTTDMEHLVRIVEAALEPRKLVPNE